MDNKQIHGDVAINGDGIAMVGNVNRYGTSEITRASLAITPGFTNVLSWTNWWSLQHERA